MKWGGRQWAERRVREILENDSCDVGVCPFSNIKSETEQSDVVEIGTSTALLMLSLALVSAAKLFNL